jgi:hypothetical protein
LLVFAFSARAGMRIHRGTWLLSLAPLAAGGGPAAAIALLCVVGAAVVCGDWLLSHSEKQQLVAGLRKRARREAPSALVEEDAQNLAAELPLV